MGRKLYAPWISHIVTRKLICDSASVGLYALQLAALYNIKTVTTCSPRNFDLVKKSGAAHVFDYSDPDVCDKITRVAPNLQYIFDTIGNEKSSELASQALQEEGGSLCTVRPGKANTENVVKRTKVTDVLVWTAFLKEHRYGEFVWPVCQYGLLLCVADHLGDANTMPGAQRRP